MAKSMKKVESPEIAGEDNAFERFLDQASKEIGADEIGAVDLDRPPGEPKHRQLRVVISHDLLEARLEAVFPDTTRAEIQEVLKRERVAWGVQEETLKDALMLADRSGRVQRDVIAARGKPAVYKKRKEVSYPFLEGLKDPKDGTPLHPASSVLRGINEVMGSTDIEMIREYGQPVVAVVSGEVLMRVQGEDEVEPGRDVFGKEIRRVQEDQQDPLKPGNGVVLAPDGLLTAETFGYVSVFERFLSVFSPVWISHDGMEAYFVNPPQLGERKAPESEAILKMLEEQGVCFGIDRDVVEEICGDLKVGTLRESCVRIAQGQRPNLSRGQIGFAFEPVPPARYEAVRDAFQALDLDDVTGCPTKVQVVRAGDVIAEQMEGEGGAGPGRDLFGESVAPPETVQERKQYQAGVNVRRVVEEGYVRYVSEVYGYAGVPEDRIMVVSPLWISPDRMEVYFVALPQLEGAARPSELEVDALLDRMKVRYGVDREAITRLCLELPVGEDVEGCAVPVAWGTPPEAGHDGRVELLYRGMPEPGKLLEKDRMDFRERDGVPQAQPGDLLARRSFPTPGKPGTDVRGKELKPPKAERDLLYAGPNVVSEEKDGEQFFHASGAGWPRVVKDTLAVMQRFQHPGNVDYKVGNIKMDGDVEVEGTVKPRFRVEATGDVFISGAVEQGAKVVAGGNVVVEGGIIGALVKAGGNVFAMFIQDAEVEAGADLVVRSYSQNSHIRVQGKATVQGESGGERQLCLLGGGLVAARGIEAASVGSAYGRETRVIAGVDSEVEAQLEKYQKGVCFSELRSRKAMRALETLRGRSGGGKREMIMAIRLAPPGRRDFLIRQLKEVEAMQKLKLSLDHHIEDLKTKRTEIVGRAYIRVSGTAFERVTVQIGTVYKLLDEEVPEVVFRLNRKGTQIAQGHL